MYLEFQLTLLSSTNNCTLIIYKVYSMKTVTLDLCLELLSNNTCIVIKLLYITREISNQNVKLKGVSARALYCVIGKKIHAFYFEMEGVLNRKSIYIL